VSVRALPEQIYRCLWEMDLNASPLTRALLALRGLPVSFRRDRRRDRMPLTLSSIQRGGFVLLGERANDEVVFGLVARPWEAVAEIRHIDAAEFKPFAQLGFAKIAWNFRLAREDDGNVRLSTETRILCTDAASRARFRWYWLLIGPFSGLTRLEMLRLVRACAQRPTATY